MTRAEWLAGLKAGDEVVLISGDWVAIHTLNTASSRGYSWRSDRLLFSIGKSGRSKGKSIEPVTDEHRARIAARENRSRILRIDRISLTDDQIARICAILDEVQT